jgi:hypothetical protein
MTDERDFDVSRSEPAEQPAPERYYAEHVLPTTTGTESFSLAALQEAMNEGARKSWRLVGVVNEPTGQGIVLVWDQSGFISG